MDSSNEDIALDTKISSIKEEISQVWKDSYNTSPSPQASKYDVPFVIFDSKEESMSIDSNEMRRSKEWEPRTYEQQKIRVLEDRIVQKDVLLSEMSKMQNQLQKQLEHTKTELANYKSEQPNPDDALFKENKQLRKQNATLKRKITELENGLQQFIEKESRREEEIIRLQKDRLALMEDARVMKSTESMPILSDRTPRISPVQPPSSKHLLRYVKAELGVKFDQDIPKAIVGLKKDQAHAHAVRRFSNKVRDLMAQLNPISKQTSLKDVWKWIRIIFEEFMQQNNKADDKVCELLKVANSDEACEKIKKMMHNHRKISKILGKYS